MDIITLFLFGSGIYLIFINIKMKKTGEIPKALISSKVKLDRAKDMGAKGLDLAKDAGEIGKLKLQIASTEDDIKKLYVEIGKKLLEEHCETAKELFGESVEKITELKAKIEELEKMVEAVKGK